MRNEEAIYYIKPNFPAYYYMFSYMAAELFTKLYLCSFCQDCSYHNHQMVGFFCGRPGSSPLDGLTTVDARRHLQFMHSRRHVIFVFFVFVLLQKAFGGRLNISADFIMFFLIQINAKRRQTVWGWMKLCLYVLTLHHGNSHFHASLPAPFYC